MELTNSQSGFKSYVESHELPVPENMDKLNECIDAYQNDDTTKFPLSLEEADSLRKRMLDKEGQLEAESKGASWHFWSWWS